MNTVEVFVESLVAATVEADEFIKDGMSILLVDVDDFEIVNEVTDEDVEDESLFNRLIAAIEE